MGLSMVTGAGTREGKGSSNPSRSDNRGGGAEPPCGFGRYKR